MPADEQRWRPRRQGVSHPPGGASVRIDVCNDKHVNEPPYVPGYLLEYQLGTGGHGSVWVARAQASGEYVAVKLIGLYAPEQRDAAHREAATLIAAEHPHVAPFYGVVDLDGGMALVTGFADGGSVGDLLAARVRLTAGEVVTVCAPLAEALAEVHARGLVHGDVKPANVLFTGDGKPMLSDLGLWRVVGEHPGATPGFAAPEVAAGHWPSPATDVYSVAVLASVALTGQLPSFPPNLPGMAPAAHAALTHALDPDPARRPAAAALADAMYALADPEPVGLVAPAGFDGPPETGIHDDFIERAFDSGGSEDEHRRRSGRRSGRRRSPDADDAPAPAPPRRRRTSRRDVVLVALAMVVAVPVIGLGVVAVWNQLTGNPDAAMLPGAGRVTAAEEVEEDLCGGPQPAPTQEPPEVTNWTPVVEQLFAQRAAAFNEQEAEQLCELFAPTSPYLASDYQLLQTYNDEGVRTVGLRFEVINVEQVSEDGEQPVILEITDRVPAHQLVNEEGEVVAELDGVPEDTWEAELVVSPDASGWRFS